MDEENLSPSPNPAPSHESSQRTPKKSASKATPSKRGLVCHCTICNEEFVSRKAYINHIIDTHTPKPYICKQPLGNNSWSALCCKVTQIFPFPNKIPKGIRRIGRFDRTSKCFPWASNLLFMSQRICYRRIFRKT